MQGEHDNEDDNIALYRVYEGTILIRTCNLCAHHVDALITFDGYDLREVI
jgi:hypothetical protein